MTNSFCSVSDAEAELGVGYNYFGHSTTPSRDMVAAWIDGESDYIRAITRQPLAIEEETLVLDQESTGRLVYCRSGYLTSVSKVEVNEGTAFNPDWVEVTDFYIQNHFEGVIRLEQAVSFGDRRVRVTGLFGKTSLVPIAKSLCIMRVCRRVLGSVASNQLYETPLEGVSIGAVSIKMRPDRIAHYMRYYDESISRLEARLEANSLSSMLI